MTNPPVWLCRGVELSLAQPLIMGIVNVTPDSFSDGGETFSHEAAIARGIEHAAAGAAILDIGGESTRPGAESVSISEEKRRVIPVVEALSERTDAVISIDTRHAEVARLALEAGAAIVNDIEGLRDPAMRDVVRGLQAGAVIMHMRGTPKNMQQNPHYEDVVSEVYTWLEKRVKDAVASGIAPEALAIDPGIGFGKLLEHNLALIGKLKTFARMGPPLLVGLSRKRLVGEITGTEAGQRLGGSLAGLTWAIWQGASILRVHDVAESLAALKMATAIAQDT